MKKLLITSFILLGVFHYSQTTTKKYNTMTQRYEYFDSRGNMTGYEFYNSMTRQYEYYALEQRQSNQYRDPGTVDLSSTFNAQSTLQNKYDNNTAYVQQQILIMKTHVYNLDIPEEQKDKIMQSFRDKPLHSVNSQRIDYSSQSRVNEVVDYLRESINTIIKNVTSVKVSKPTYIETPAKSFSDYYNKQLKVWSIYEYVGEIGTTLSIKLNPYIVVTENEIKFRRTNGSLSYRELSNKKYNSVKRGYEYTSQYGAVFIQEDFRYVEFFQTSNPFGDNFTYILSK